MNNRSKCKQERSAGVARSAPFHHLMLAALLVIFGCARITLAQINTAAVFGTVVDSTSRAIPSANVSIRNIATNHTTKAQTNEEGLFSLNPLVPGEYSLQIEAAGFQSRSENGIRLAAGDRVRGRYVLQVATVAQSVDVAADAALVNLDNAEQRSAATDREVERLPLAKRDWTALSSVGAGLLNNPERGTLIVNGLPSSGFRFTADGVDAGGQSYLPAFSQYQNYNLIKGVSREAIAEVAITRGITSADVGPTMAGNVNVITRSGTNTLHGSLFWTNNVEDLNGRDPFAVSRQPVVYNQYGGSLGGPVVRDKLFYFVAYEGYQQRSQISVSGNVPTAEFRAQATAALPAYKSWTDTFPLPNQPYAPGSTAGLFLGSGSQSDEDNHGTARADYYFSPTTMAFFRYSRARPDQTAPNVSPSNPRIRNGYSEGGAASLFHSQGRWLLESRFGINYNDEQRVDGYYLLGINSIRRLGGIDAGGGENLFQGGRTISFGQNVTWTQGKHTLKFGANLIRRLAQRGDVQVPELRYANLTDFFANIPNQIQVTYGVSTYHLRTAEYGLYLQEGWRVNSRLVLNLGMRWDYFGPATEDDGRIYNRGGAFGLGAYLPNAKSWNANLADFSPRLSLAYRLNNDGTRVLRAGFGMFHSPHVLLGGPIGIVRDSQTTPNRAIFSRQDVLTYGSVLQFPVTNSATLPLARVADSGLAINTNYPDPYSLQWTIGLQQQIGRVWKLDTAYVGNHAVHLTMLRAMNQPDRVTGLRPVASLGTFNYYDSSESSRYQSWETTLERRFAAGLVASLNYVWARSFSLTSEADLISPPTPQDPFHARADYGPSLADIHHRVTATFVYDLPVPKSWLSGRAMPHLLGGWSISGILTAQTGQPVNIIQSSGLDSSRPDATGVAPVLSNYRDTLRYLNPAAFTLVPVNSASGLPARPGNVGRNAVHGPGLWTMDLSLGKSFSFGERARVRVNADALNSFNHTNYGDPGTDVTSSTFGLITSARGARVIQLSARISF